MKLIQGGLSTGLCSSLSLYICNRLYFKSVVRRVIRDFNPLEHAWMYICVAHVQYIDNLIGLSLSNKS